MEVRIDKGALKSDDISDDCAGTESVVKDEDNEAAAIKEGYLKAISDLADIITYDLRDSLLDWEVSGHETPKLIFQLIKSQSNGWTIHLQMSL